MKTLGIESGGVISDAARARDSAPRLVHIGALILAMCASLSVLARAGHPYHS